MDRKRLPENFQVAFFNAMGIAGISPASCYSELPKTSTALARLAVTCVLSAACRFVLIFVNPL